MVEQLNTDQIRAFFEFHFGKLPYRDSFVIQCPFHSDKTPSLSLNLRKGAWNCHAGCGSGGLIDFQIAKGGGDRDSAIQKVNEICGEQIFGGNRPEAIYQYRDAQGIVLFEKVRYKGKQFKQRRPTDKGTVMDLEGVKKPLYNLPEIVTASEVFVCEGEKDADNLAKAIADCKLTADVRVATTTNFDGADNWRPEYNAYFAGKRVVVLPDADAIGEKHAEKVAAAVYPYAIGIKIVKLPGLQDKGDVSDYLTTHTADDLVQEIKKTKQWFPPKSEQELFVPAPTFLTMIHPEIDWMVEGVMTRKANGFFAASPKGGKSWAALDLAIALALGEPWLGFTIPRPVKVALISREDDPALTSWRMKALVLARAAQQPWLFEDNLYINTRAQSAELMIDNKEQMDELLAAMKVFKPEFAIFDVFNVLHCADENDNTKMRAVLRRLSRVQAEIGCSLGVIHHYNKGEGTMTERLRGASAIAGWVEWMVGISMYDDEQKIRKMEFESKAAQPPDPIYYRIDSGKRDGIDQAKLSLVSVTPKASRSKISFDEVFDTKTAAAGNA